MSEPLAIEHDPPGYKMEIRMGVFGEDHIFIRMGEMNGISLDEGEVKRVVGWLQGWLIEHEKQTQEYLTSH